MQPSSPLIRPTWPFGCRFVDARGRKFEVIWVIMGNPNIGVSYTIDFDNGWKLTKRSGYHPQYQAGFVELTNKEKVIVELVEKLDQYVANGHLKMI